MIKTHLRHYWMLIKFNTKLDVAYNINFWVSFLTDFAIYFIQVITFSAIFMNVGTINGWNMYHMIFFLGTFTIIDSLCMMTYFFGLIFIPRDIRQGELDKFIVKPINTLFYMVTRHFQFSNILNVFMGIGFVIYAVSNLAIEVTMTKVVGYIALLILMYLLLFGLMLIVRTTAFWFINIDALMELEDQLMNFAFKIPGVVFQGIYKAIFFFVLPYGLIATIPTQYFTENLTGVSLVVPCVIAVGFFTLSVKIWNIGIKHYSSASS